MNGIRALQIIFLFFCNCPVTSDLQKSKGAEMAKVG